MPSDDKLQNPGAMQLYRYAGALRTLLPVALFVSFIVIIRNH